MFFVIVSRMIPEVINTQRRARLNIFFMPLECGVVQGSSVVKIVHGTSICVRKTCRIFNTLETKNVVSRHVASCRSFGVADITLGN